MLVLSCYVLENFVGLCANYSPALGPSWFPHTVTLKSPPLFGSPLPMRTTAFFVTKKAKE